MKEDRKPAALIIMSYGLGDMLVQVNFMDIDASDKARLSRVGKLLAWDPVTQQERWSVPHPVPYSSGVLSTAGGLVFQMSGSGEFAAYAAETGKRLWSTRPGSIAQTAPVSYAVQGKQFVLLPVGLGGFTRSMRKYATVTDAQGPSRLLAYALGGDAVLPASDVRFEVPEPPQQKASSEKIERGKALYGDTGCLLCHGVNAVFGPGSSVPDLRYMSSETHAQFQQIVLGGIRSKLGMPAFNEALNADQVAAIHGYLIERQKELYQQQRQ